MSLRRKPVCDFECFECVYKDCIVQECTIEEQNRCLHLPQEEKLTKKEYAKQYREAHREEIRKKSKEYYARKKKQASTLYGSHE